MDYAFLPIELICPSISLIEGTTTLHRGDPTYSWLYRGMDGSDHAFEKVLTETGE